MPKGKRGTKRQIVDKVQLTIYEDDAELWQSMRQVSGHSTKAGTVWESGA